LSIILQDDSEPPRPNLVLYSPSSEYHDISPDTVPVKGKATDITEPRSKASDFTKPRSKASRSLDHKKSYYRPAGSYTLVQRLAPLCSLDMRSNMIAHALARSTLAEPKSISSLYAPVFYVAISLLFVAISARVRLSPLNRGQRKLEKKNSKNFAPVD